MTAKSATDMAAAAGEAARLMAALSNETRLLILCQLAQGEAAVGDLVDRLDLRQANVSQHLALLRKDGLVQTRRVGQKVYYAIKGEAPARILEVLYDLYCA